MKVITLTICMLIIHVISAEVRNDHCDRSHPIGPYYLKVTEGIVPQYNKTKIKARAIVGPREVEVLMGYRLFYNTYVFEGVFWKPRKESEDYVFKVPSVEEVKKWEKKTQCNVGKDVQTMTASDGGKDFCNDLDPKMEEWVDSKELSTHVHTRLDTGVCVRSWTCGFEKSKLRVHYEPNRYLKFNGEISDWNSLLNVSVITDNDTVVSVPMNQDLVHDLGGGYFFYVLEQSFDQITEYEIELICFESLEISCIAICDCPINHKVFDIRRGKWICHRNVCIFPSFEKKRTRRAIKDENRAASIKDVLDIIRDNDFQSESSSYNELQLLKGINKNRELLMGVIESLSRIDDKLIGHLLGKPLVSKWITQSAFYLYPCKDLSLGQTNCHDGHFYRDGRWLKGTPEDNFCKNMPHVDNLSLFDDLDVFITKVVHSPPEGLIKDQEGWTYIASRKAELERIILSTQKIESGGALDFLSGFSPLGIGSLLAFSGVSSIISYVALGLAILALVRR